MNLFNFEKQIDEIIKRRGKNYYDKGHVVSVQMVREGFYSIIVRGTEDYNVSVALDKSREIVSMECDCPYDMGLICKHIVAALYSIRSSITGEKKDTEPGDRGKGKQIEAEKRNTQLGLVIPKDSFKDLLIDLPKEELLNIILELALDDEQIRNKLEFRYSADDIKNEIKSCSSMIRKCISKYSDRNGYISYESAYEALEGAAQVLERAEKLAEVHEDIRAVKICLCVFEELLDVYQDMDDSDGYAGSQIESAIQVIQDIAYRPMDSETAVALFELLFEASHMPCFEDWPDWKLELLDACIALCTSDSHKALLTEYLQQLLEVYRKDPYSNYKEEQVIMLKYQLLHKEDDPIMTESFLHEYIHYPSVREIIIQGALDKGEYNKVIELVLEGELQDADRRGLVKRWKQYRYSAYEKSGQLEAQRALATELVFDEDFEYYKKLRTTHSKTEWNEIYPKILEHFETHGRVHNCYIKALLEEKEYERLLVYVQNNPTEITLYYKYLLKDHREAVYSIFAEYAMLMSDRSSNRKDYQKVCNIIRQLIKLGGVKQGDMLIAKLMSKYNRRPAFIQELSGINS